MCKFNPKNDSRRIDPCMKEEIKEFNKALKLFKHYLDYFKIVACCCGHGKYSKTIILKSKAELDDVFSYFDHFSGVEIPRTRNFYKKDKQGIYYIPEVHKPKEVKETIFYNWDKPSHKTGNIGDAPFPGSKE